MLIVSSVVKNRPKVTNFLPNDKKYCKKCAKKQQFDPKSIGF